MIHFIILFGFIASIINHCYVCPKELKRIESMDCVEYAKYCELEGIKGDNIFNLWF
jgi:hypothetical protein